MNMHMMIRPRVRNIKRNWIKTNKFKSECNIFRSYLIFCVWTYLQRWLVIISRYSKYNTIRCLHLKVTLNNCQIIWFLFSLRTGLNLIFMLHLLPDTRLCARACVYVRVKMRITLTLRWPSLAGLRRISGRVNLPVNSLPYTVLPLNGSSLGW